MVSFHHHYVLYLSDQIRFKASLRNAKALRPCELARASASPSTAQVLPPTTMSALNVFLEVAEIAEASSVPYLENVAKVVVVIFELLEVCLIVLDHMDVVAYSATCVL